MEVKEIWTIADFDAMNWHDARLYSLSFPNDKLELSLSLDYIFQWQKEGGHPYKFWVSPCELTFWDVLNFRIDLDFQNSVGLDIQCVKREGGRLSPNGKVTVWDFDIETDKGTIFFQSTGFTQTVLSQPVLSASQDLNS